MYTRSYQKWLMASFWPKLYRFNHRTLCRFSGSCRNLLFNSYWMRHRREVGNSGFHWSCTRNQALDNLVLSTRYYISCVIGLQYEFPISIEHNTIHTSSCLGEASKMVTAKTIWKPRRDTVSENKVNVLSPSTTSHILLRSSVLDSKYGKSSGKRKTLSSSPISSITLEYTSNAKTMTEM